MGMRILVVEDEAKIASLLQKSLSEDHYSVDIAPDGEEGLYLFDVNEYDLIILDIMLPKKDGITVCKEIRKKNNSTPILMLTAKDTVPDKVLGLDVGADDYLVKPFSFIELKARVRALLRRGNKSDGTVLKVADILLDPARKEVTRSGHYIPLTAREYSLLEYFLRNPNRVLTKSQLLEHVWDSNYEGLSNIVETYVKYIRQKLRIDSKAKEIIHTKRGLGYILQE